MTKLTIVFLFFPVRLKQHNIPKFIQDETVDHIRRDPYGVRCNNECGKLQVITVFIEIRMFSIFPISSNDVIINIVFVPQLLQEAGDDIIAVHTADIVPIASVLVPLFADVYEVDHVLCCGNR